jgi:hypothetical protein
VYTLLCIVYTVLCRGYTVLCSSLHYWEVVYTAVHCTV